MPTKIQKKDNSTWLRSVIAGVSGSLLEWYDISLYVTLAPILANQFFGELSHFKAIFSVFASFLLGYILRPVGGIIFGYIGDRYGRRKSIIISMTSSITSITITTSIRWSRRCHVQTEQVFLLSV